METTAKRFFKLSSAQGNCRAQHWFRVVYCVDICAVILVQHCAAENKRQKEEDAEMLKLFYSGIYLGIQGVLFIGVLCNYSVPDRS